MTPRKQPGKATAPRNSVPLPLAETRREIWSAASDLIAACDSRDISEVLGRRFRVPQAVIARIMVMEALRYEREAAALRSGMRNALQLARDAGASIYDDGEPEAKTG